MSPMMAEKELLVLNKLEYLKEIKVNQSQLEMMRSKLSEEMDLVHVEERCLSEYRREMDSLYQEKMTHVEELRQIHSDINMLENVLKQSEEDRARRVETIKLLHHQMMPLCDKVNKMRTEMGLTKLAERDEETIDKVELEKRFGKHDPDCRAMSIEAKGGHKAFGGDSGNATQTQHNPQMASNPAFSSSLASLVGFQEKHQPSTFGRMLMNSATGQSGTSGPSFHHAEPSSLGGNSGGASSTSSPAAFRQQPPPMKSCLSCHQQIHRNAPICPLCKAKSRSRHPKRRNKPQP